MKGRLTLALRLQLEVVHVSRFLKPEFILLSLNVELLDAYGYSAFARWVAGLALA